MQSEPPFVQTLFSDKIIRGDLRHFFPRFVDIVEMARLASVSKEIHQLFFSYGVYNYNFENFRKSLVH